MYPAKIVQISIRKELFLKPTYQNISPAEVFI